MVKNWTIKTSHPENQAQLSDTLNIHPIIAQLLINRGIEDPKEAQSFLSSDLSQLSDPFQLKDMDRAVERVKKAQRLNERVLIYGDYDVDGVTSSALLRRVLHSMGVICENYIPHRMDEGYGLNEGIVEFIQQSNVQLVITVDCGISAFGPIKALNAAGVDTIIIDHHQPDLDCLPEAFAVINPKRSDCTYPHKNLAAVGLVAKFTQGLLGYFPQEDLDLVAIGTIADVVELTGENRIFVRHGLPLIEKSDKHGLNALLDVAKIRGKKMKPYYIGFILGPRINAAGRMDSARLALDLLLSDNYEEAAALAKTLEVHNQERQRMQSSVVDEAIDMIENEIAIKDKRIIVVHKEGWHKGVLGIVASRIVEKYYRPAFVISVKDGVGIGSARSVEGFHLFDALTNCSAILENFGGHKRAAGLKVRYENIEAFKNSMNDFAKANLSTDTLIPVLDIDCEISLSEINMELVNAVNLFEPYGEGNPIPIFCSRNLQVKSTPVVMSRDTIKFWVFDGQSTISVVGFGMGSFKDQIRQGTRLDLAYILSIDDWNKEAVVQLQLKDIKVN